MSRNEVSSPNIFVGFDNPPGPTSRRRRSRAYSAWVRRAVAAGATACLLAAGAVVAPSAIAAVPGSGPGTVANGVPLTDTNGNTIQAHGGGFLKQKVNPETNAPDPNGVDTWFWVGEDKSSNSANGNPVHLYKSIDLTNWEDLGTILDTASFDEGGNQPLNHNKLERPKLLYSEQTGKYVLWVHYETASSYSASEILIATSDSVAGTYTIQGGADGTSVHSRPGAGENSVEAFGNRYGSAVRDWDNSITSRITGKADINTSRPVVPDYPYNAKLYTEEPNVTTQWGTTVQIPNGSGGTISYTPRTITSVAPRTQPFGDSGTANSYGSSGWAWSFELDNIQNDTTVKATTVRMTDYDQTFWDLYQEAARSVGVEAIRNQHLIRYPAKEGTFGAEAATTSGPSAANDIDTSETVASTFDIVATGADTFQDLVAPRLHPGVDEKADPAADAVLVNPKDMVFITAPMSGGEIWYTTDGTEPAINGPGSTRYYQNAGNHITVSDRVGAGEVLEVKTKSFKDGQASETTTVSYRLAEASEADQVPLFKPVFSVPGGKYTSIGYKHINLYSPTFGAEVYYTADGVDPKNVLQVKGDNLGYGSRDLTVWQDPQTGKGYLITAQDHIYIRIWELTDDFTGVDPTRQYDTYVGVHREAPALVRVGEYVYLFTSSQSGWHPNQGQYARTLDIADGFDNPRNLEGITTESDFLDRANFDGPNGDGAYPKDLTDAEIPSIGHRNGSSVWSELQPFGDNTNYRSQPTKIFDIGTAEDPEYLFFGDRWNPAALGKSTYTFYPLEIDNDAAGPSGVQGKATLTFAPSVQISRAEDGTLRVAEPLTRNLALEPGVVVTSSTPGVRDSGVSYDPEVVVDGEDWDLDNYDDIEPFFRGNGGNYWVTLELPEAATLSGVGFSSRLIGGSEATHYYQVLGSNDGQTWDTLVDAVDNTILGHNYQAASGVYKFVKLNITGNSRGDWASGVYELAVYGESYDSDTTALDSAIERAQEILTEHQGEYTFESLLDLNTALTTAVSLKASGATSTANMATAVEAIDTAIDGLIPLPAEETVNKDALIGIYFANEQREEEQYTPESWAPFATALEGAKTVLLDAEATQAAVNSAVSALQSAVDGLVSGPDIEDVEVSFRFNGVGGTDRTDTLPVGSLLSPPVFEDHEGYSFAGWFTDEQLQEEFDFATPVEASLTLYAKWVSTELAVTADATTKCVAGKAVVTVKATNGADVAVDLVATSAFGSKLFANVAPGKSVSQAFSTRLATLYDGEISVGVTPTSGDAGAHTIAVPFTGTVCN